MRQRLAEAFTVSASSASCYFRVDVKRYDDWGYATATRSLHARHESRCKSVFATLECELLDRHRFATPEAASLGVSDYIES
jgi:hypothetical protein